MAVAASESLSVAGVSSWVVFVCGCAGLDCGDDVDAGDDEDVDGASFFVVVGVGGRWCVGVMESRNT